MLDNTKAYEAEERPLREAAFKGWKCRCPQCGNGALYGGYLKVNDSCDFCGEEFSHHRADDAPSWLTMIIVGHLLAPLMILAYETLTVPPWIHAIAWPVIAMTLVIVLLPRIKGIVIAFQWAHRMHGFDDTK